MSLTQIIELTYSIILSLGVSGAIIFGLSSWLGKVWANRLMAEEKFKHQQSLLSLSENIKKENAIELERLKSNIESNSYVERLDQTHFHEQRKNIKESISKNKVNIINAADELNHRLWNFSENYSNNWHKKNDKSINEQYYLYSFAYRLLAFYAWCAKAEGDMIYLDSTVAEDKDLDFVKFLKLFPQIMCDASLFSGVEYDVSHDTDHFYKNDFNNMIRQMIVNEQIISFEEFKIKITSEKLDVEKVINFLSEINPHENRLRWPRVAILHIALLMFMNTFGYDFQHTSTIKVKELQGKYPKNLALLNFEQMLCRLNLKENKEVAEISRELRSI